MNITYSKESGAIYIPLIEGQKEVDHSKEIIKDRLIIDFSKTLVPLGIEILGIDNFTFESLEDSLDDIIQRYEEEIELFQTNCPHKDIETKRLFWAPGHRTEPLPTCNRCRKVFS